jgi:hypothetical protein
MVNVLFTEARGRVFFGWGELGSLLQDSASFGVFGKIGPSGRYVLPHAQARWARLAKERARPITGER